MTTQANEAEIGMNRTGAALSPELTARMIEGNSEFPLHTGGDASEIANVRQESVRDAVPIGTVPPPATLKGVVKTAATGLLGRHPTLFIDKLSERLAYERSGVRLYEALIAKFDTQGGFDGGPERAQLEEMMMQEYQHFRLLVDAVNKVGGDPTVMSPSADVQATIASGPLSVIVDPRTSFNQCLEALLVVELADNACWEALVELAQKMGEQELAVQFEQARTEEDEHLLRVSNWIAISQDREELAAQ
jgi:rubrerythrin